MGKSCSIETESCGFKCTGYDGSHIWKKLHDLVKGVECDTCREHAIKLMSGLHDHVNAGLGEKMYDEKNYEKFVNEVICVHDSRKGEPA